MIRNSRNSSINCQANVSSKELQIADRRVKNCRMTTVKYDERKIVTLCLMFPFSMLVALLKFVECALSLQFSCSQTVTTLKMGKKDRQSVKSAIAEMDFACIAASSIKHTHKENDNEKHIKMRTESKTINIKRAFVPFQVLPRSFSDI